MIASPWTPAPPDHSATEIVAPFLYLSQCWENDDGTATVVAALEGGVQARGQLETKGELTPGLSYRWLGRWKEHPRWGWQFNFDLVTPEAPSSPSAVAAYLAKYADGIGPVTAQVLVDAYGEQAIAILQEDGQRVVEDGHVTADVATSARLSLEQVCDPQLREAHVAIFSLLKGHGFYAKAIRAALRRWRSRAAELVRRDPFLLMTNGLPGCGFLKCDRLYCSLGHPPRRLKRQGLAAWYALSSRDGDTWMALSEAMSAIRTQIGGTEPRERRAVALMARAGLMAFRTVGDAVWIADRHKATSERIVAMCVQRLLGTRAQWPAVEKMDCPDWAGPFDALSDHQAGELRLALASPVAILTGSPGTGKTFVAAALIRSLIEQHGSAKVAVVAPTGKAAVRISEKLAELQLGIQATTVHRLLKVTPMANTDAGWGFDHDEEKPLPHRFIVVDETSMMDVGLMASLLRACSRDTHILLTGDIHQLPPVGHGAPLRDLLAAGIPAARLSEIRRNAGRIVHACRSIKDGTVPDLPNSLSRWPQENLIHLPAGKSNDVKERQRLLEERLASLYQWLASAPRPDPKDTAQTLPPWHLIDDVQVICARNVTRQLLNRQLQALLNAAGEKGPAGPYRVGDKVICLCNGFVAKLNARDGEKQEYVANGDIGRVKGFRGRQMIVDLKSPPRLVAVPLGRQAEEEQAQYTGADDSDRVAGSWDLAYAVTCHKFQGSETPVTIVLVEGAGKLGSREHIYTSLSRARELCLLIGERSEVARYVRNVTLPDRKTFLTQLLQGVLPL